MLVCAACGEQVDDAFASAGHQRCSKCCDNLSCFQTIESSLAIPSLKNVDQVIIRLCGLECGRPATVHCASCRGVLCDECNTETHSSGKLLKHERVVLRDGGLPAMWKTMCSHHRKEIDQYCSSCDAFICIKCFEETHIGHIPIPLASFATTSRHELVKQASQLEKLSDHLSSSAATVEASAKQIQEAHDAFSTELEEAFYRIKRALDARKDELLAESKELCESRVRHLQQHASSLRYLGAQLADRASVAHKASKHDTPHLIATTHLEVKSVLKAFEAEAFLFLPCAVAATESNTNPDHLLAAISTFATIHPRLPTVSCDYSHDNDENGALYYIGSNELQDPWINPALSRLVKVSMSSTAAGTPAAIVGRTGTECWTDDVPGSWVTVDFMKYAVQPTRYTLRHGDRGSGDALRCWELLGSTDGSTWESLSRHVGDMSLQRPFQVASWEVRAGVSETRKAYRWLRVALTGPNSTGRHRLAVSGFEVYGTLQYF